MIGRDGFAAATVGEITREAGASLGLLNYHFGSKDEVVAEAFAAAAREDLAALEAISRRFEDPAERLAAYLDQSEWADADSLAAVGRRVGRVRRTRRSCATRWAASTSAGAPCSPRCSRTASARAAGSARTRRTRPRGWSP